MRFLSVYVRVLQHINNTYRPYFFVLYKHFWSASVRVILPVDNIQLSPFRLFSMYSSAAYTNACSSFSSTYKLIFLRFSLSNGPHKSALQSHTNSYFFGFSIHYIFVFINAIQTYISLSLYTFSLLLTACFCTALILSYLSHLHPYSPNFGLPLPPYTAVLDPPPPKKHKSGAICVWGEGAATLF